MPPPGAYFRRLFQLGKETVAGTAVPATWQYVGDTLPTFELDRYFADYPRGVRLPVTAGGTPLRQGTLYTRTSEVTYEEIMAPLESGICAGVAAGTATRYSHLYLPTVTGNPGVNTLTAEYAEGDGSGTAFGYPGATGYMLTAQTPFLFCTGFDLEWAFNAITKLTERYAGRPSTFAAASVPTAALTPLTGRERIPSNLFQVFMDTTWASLGTTALAGTVRSGKLSVNTGLAPDYTTDGRNDLGFTQLLWTQNLMATLSLVMEVNATAAAELKAWVAQNAGGGALAPNSASGGSANEPRFIRLSAISPNQLSTRSVSDGVTTLSSATITSATAAFTAGDIGATVTGSASIPAGAYIISVTNATTAVLSVNATAASTVQTFNINGRRLLWLDNSMIYSKPPVFSQQNKVELVTLELVTEYDPTSGNGFQARTINSLATFT